MYMDILQLISNPGVEKEKNFPVLESIFITFRVYFNDIHRCDRVGHLSLHVPNIQGLHEFVKIFRWRHAISTNDRIRTFLSLNLICFWFWYFRYLNLKE